MKPVLQAFVGCVQLGLGLAPACSGALSELPASSPPALELHTNTFARAPYLQLATPNSIVVVWRTVGSARPVVRYGTTVENLDHQVAESFIVTRVSLTTNKTELKVLEEKQPELFRLPKLH